MTVIGTLIDRINNRLVRHFPGPAVWIDPAEPIVSFTFDDVPKSAWTAGARILEEEGVRGTFYISGAFIDADDEGREMISAGGCADLTAKGHELGCHTYSHQKLPDFSKSTLRADLDRNEKALAQFDGTEKLRSFSFPFGVASPFRQPELRRRFKTSRGIMPAINRGKTDPFNLAAVELRPDQSYLEAADYWLSDVLQNRGWLIFFTHDVSPKPGVFGCPDDKLRDLVRTAKAGGAKIMTVEAAADALGLTNPSRGRGQ
jgi:peptidoglycan/xylan/chitin deacetylase (PgdA/CDA1 family)